MYYYEVAPVKIVRAGVDVLTYASKLLLERGQLVSIPVGKNTLTGLVLKKVPKPRFDTKLVTEIIESQALPKALVELSIWLGRYYHTPIATVLQTVLPRGLKTKRRAKPEAPQVSVRNRTKIVLNKEQLAAVTSINSSDGGSIILQGITGSGKTEVYKAVAKEQLEHGKSTIVLVPEISLTSQLVDEFASEFQNVIVTHSQMTEADRHTAWRTVLTSTTPYIIIGPRSALFLPVPSIGAIIVDEFHEPSYKQEQAPRYSAVRAASILGQLSGAKVVFGSATPSVADTYIAKQKNRPTLYLHTLARSSAKKPNVSLVDMTKRTNFTRHRFLSDELLKEIEENVERKKQTLIFHNRRGSTSSTLCENCGWTAMCNRCFVPLTLHADRFELVCHICGNHEKPPTSCPVCRHANIVHKGIGTKLIEAELQRLFPKLTIARFDSDTKSDQTVAALYKELYEGNINIAIGTQVVAKGLDLPELRTVGVIQADSGLALPDYVASERTFQLLAQVIGRVGRNEHDTNVVVQSYQPTHPVIVFGLNQDYEGFYAYAINERKKAHFPPFTYLLQLTTSYKSEARAVAAAASLATTLRGVLPKNVDILGPTPAFYERTRDSYRWQLVLKSNKRDDLLKAIDHLPSTHWQSEIDPSSLL